MSSNWQPASTQRGLIALAEKHQSYSRMENLVQTPSHFTWEISGKPISIHLHYDVVDRLSQEVMRGFGAVPRRGAEVGGVLLGTIEVSDRIVVHVEDFEIVPCDYKRGPSFLLTEQDEERFRSTVDRFAQSPDKRIYTVGYYRSHTRDGLSLTDEDIDLYHRYFADPSQVILLVRPFATKVSVGGFFFEEEDGFRSESSYQEFPFRRKELGGGSPASARAAANEAAQNAAGAAPAPDGSSEAPAAEGDDLRGWLRPRSDGGDATGGDSTPADSSSARFRGKWVWIPLSFVFLLLGVIVGFQAALVMNKGDAQRIALQSLTLSLSVEKDGDTVVIRWDRGSAAVQNAKQGTLHILDGEFRKSVSLDPKQLQNGSVIYRSADSRVGFRLDVQTNERGSISEAVEFDPASKAK